MALDAVKRDHVAFVTFTLRHNRSMALAPLRKLLALAYSELKAGRPGAALRDALGYVGDIKAAEQTWGERNGWHPHLHAPWMFNRRPSAEELKTLLSDRWRRVLTNAHHRLTQALDYFISGRGPRAARERKTCSCAKCSPVGEKSTTCGVYRYGSLGTDNQRDYALRMFGSRYVQKNVRNPRFGSSASSRLLAHPKISCQISTTAFASSSSARPPATPPRRALLGEVGPRAHRHY
jgi:hypothetical protein